jgi:hypothetical protein
MDVEEDEEYEYEEYPEDEDEEYQFQDEDDYADVPSPVKISGPRTNTNNGEAKGHAPSNHTNGAIGHALERQSSEQMAVCNDTEAALSLDADAKMSSSLHSETNGIGRLSDPGTLPQPSYIMTSSSSSSSTTAVPKTPVDGSYLLTDYTNIYPRLEVLMSDVCALLDVSPDTAQILLQTHKWDKEKLIDKFFSDSEKLLEECGMNLFSADILAG